MQVKSLSRCLVWAVVAALAVSCHGQVMQPPGTMPGGHHIHVPEPPPHTGVAQPPAAITQPGTPGQPGTPAQPGNAHIQLGTTAGPAPSAAPSLPPSLLDKPATHASVTLSGGSLSVKANNASLSDILKDVSSTSGMTVDGFGKDTRVFGVYGPGSPRDVISELLDGAGYNFLMVGDTDAGTPREIVLTTRGNTPLPNPQPSSVSQPDEDDEPANNPPADQAAPPVQPPALAPDQRQQPRTPQEMLQELQRLRQQQGQTPAQPQPQN
jgi:hypothetical protein